MWFLLVWSYSSFYRVLSILASWSRLRFNPDLYEWSQIQINSIPAHLIPSYLKSFLIKPQTSCPHGTAHLRTFLKSWWSLSLLVWSTCLLSLELWAISTFSQAVHNTRQILVLILGIWESFMILLYWQLDLQWMDVRKDHRIWCLWWKSWSWLLYGRFILIVGQVQIILMMEVRQYDHNVKVWD